MAVLNSPFRSGRKYEEMGPPSVLPVLLRDASALT